MYVSLVLCCLHEPLSSGDWGQRTHSLHLASAEMPCHGFGYRGLLGDAKDPRHGETSKVLGAESGSADGMDEEGQACATDIAINPACVVQAENEIGHSPLGSKQNTMKTRKNNVSTKSYRVTSALGGQQLPLAFAPTSARFPPRNPHPPRTR